MGEYRRGESRSGSSQFGLLVEQEDDERTNLHGPKYGSRCEHLSTRSNRAEQLSASVGHFVCRAKYCAGGDGRDVYDFRSLSAVHGRVGVGDVAKHVWCDCGGEDQADRI